MVYVVLQRSILVQMKAPVSKLFYKESYWYKRQLQCLCGSTKNHIDATRDSRVYMVLQRMILVQIEAPGVRLFYSESYWYKCRLHCLCGSTKNHTGTNGDSGI